MSKEKSFVYIDSIYGKFSYLDGTNIPKSNRLKIGRKYISLSQPNIRMPIEWQMKEHPLLLQFFGYWLAKGYYEKFSVVIPAGNHIADLMPAFDYVAQLFKCNYKIRENKLVKFDSAMLKYVMFGFGFTKDKQNEKTIPLFISYLCKNERNEFYRAFFTARAKIIKKGILISVKSVDLLKRLRAEIEMDYSTDIHTIIHFSKLKLLIPLASCKDYLDQIGFLSVKLNVKLMNIIPLKNETAN